MRPTLYIDNPERKSMITVAGLMPRVLCVIDSAGAKVYRNNKRCGSYTKAPGNSLSACITSGRLARDSTESGERKKALKVFDLIIAKKQVKEVNESIAAKEAKADRTLDQIFGGPVVSYSNYAEYRKELAQLKKDKGRL